MKSSRPRRLLFRSMTVFSLLVLVAAVALDLRSQFATDFINWTYGNPDEVIRTSPGFIVFGGNSDIPPIPPPGFKYDRGPPQQLPSYRYRNFLGNRFRSIHIRLDDEEQRLWEWAIPLWQPIAASALLPALGMYRHLSRRRRLRTNHCLLCGYDLRATPERCPECGTIPAIAQVSTNA